jgi:hypothetical protein
MSKQNRFSIESDILRVHDARIIVSAEFCKWNETLLYPDSESLNLENKWQNIKIGSLYYKVVHEIIHHFWPWNS